MLRPPALPVAERTHGWFWRTPALSWWQPLVALVLAGVFFVVASVVQAVPLIVDLVAGRLRPEDVQGGKLPMSPGLLAGVAIGMALLVPAALVVQKVAVGQSARWLHSVEGRFRWGWLLRCLAVVAPLWALWMLAPLLLEAPPAGDRRHLLAYLAVTLLLIPLQSAGEEYLFRGVINRSLAAWFPSEAVGLAVGAVVSSALFMLVHGAGSLWLNIYYFGLGMLFCAMTWRTGGLEAAVALHAVNNVISFVLAASFGQMDQSFERGAGAGDPALLISLVVGLVALALLEVWHRRGPWLRTNAPGRTPPEAAGDAPPTGALPQA